MQKGYLVGIAACMKSFTPAPPLGSSLDPDRRPGSVRIGGERTGNNGDGSCRCDRAGTICNP